MRSALVLRRFRMTNSIKSSNANATNTKYLEDWVYNSKIELIVARLNSSKGGERDNLRAAIKSATLRAIVENNYNKSADLTIAFPNMHRWKLNALFTHNRKYSKVRSKTLLSIITLALIITAITLALISDKISFQILFQEKVMKGLVVVGIVMLASGFFLNPIDDYYDNRSVGQEIGKVLTLAGLFTFSLMAVLTLAQFAWLLLTTS
jgi:hypothetical protein